MRCSAVDICSSTWYHIDPINQGCGMSTVIYSSCWQHKIFCVASCSTLATICSGVFCRGSRVDGIHCTSTHLLRSKLQKQRIITRHYWGYCERTKMEDLTSGIYLSGFSSEHITFAYGMRQNPTVCNLQKAVHSFRANTWLHYRTSLTESQCCDSCTQHARSLI